MNLSLAGQHRVATLSASLAETHGISRTSLARAGALELPKRLNLPEPTSPISPTSTMAPLPRTQTMAPPQTPPRVRRARRAASAPQAAQRLRVLRQEYLCAVAAGE